jgi:hypothetical protein
VPTNEMSHKVPVHRQGRSAPGSGYLAKMRKENLHNLMRYLSLVIAMASLGASPATTQSVVSVTMKPANVQQRSFDPDSPPGGLPLDPAVEAACSAALFSCHCDVDLRITDETPGALGTQITAEVTAVRVTLCLDDTMWLPEQASAKLLAHEQGHAKISQTFFARAEHPVEDAAEKMIGETISAEAEDHQTAMKAAAQKVTDKIARIYKQETTTASSPVQQAYDQLTDHSRNNVPEDTAIPLAMKHAIDPGLTQAAK